MEARAAHARRMELLASARLLVVALRSIIELLVELLFGPARLDRSRLTVQRGVDRVQLGAAKACDFKAYTDGALLCDGRAGIGVYYSDGHPRNASRRLQFAPSVPPDANIAELAALFWVLEHHPRGVELTVFSDSAHALRAVEALADDARPPRIRGGGNSGSRSRAIAEQGARYVTAIHWVLRLRTARTRFCKVPGHRGFKGNELANALAQCAADGPTEADGGAVPLARALRGGVDVIVSLLRYLTRQDDADEVAELARAPGRPPNRRLRRPGPIGPSNSPSYALALDCEMVGVGRGGTTSALASVRG